MAANLKAWNKLHFYQDRAVLNEMIRGELVMWTEKLLNEKLCEPSQTLISDMKKIDGDIIVLGSGGKMGPTLCLLAKNAIDKASIDKKVIAVSRFTDESAQMLLKDNDIETISCDLMETGAIENLPDCPNIIYMAGRKFGTSGQEPLTWAMNSILPAKIAYRYRQSNIVVFSSGNVYPMTEIRAGGATEACQPQPNGEYAMSCLARERIFQYHSITYGTKIMIYRLSFAVDLRYGVLRDIGETVRDGKPISLSMPAFNCIWQGDANEIAIRGLLHTGVTENIYNVTGPKIASTKYAASKLAEYMMKEVTFTDMPSDTAFVANSQKTMHTFGYPQIDLDTMLKWQAEWILAGGRSLNKPTHYEVRDGQY